MRGIAGEIQQRAFEWAADRPKVVSQEPRGVLDAPLPFLWNIKKC
jgi:hypothetical protein